MTTANWAKYMECDADQIPTNELVYVYEYAITTCEGDVVSDPRVKELRQEIITRIMTGKPTFSCIVDDFVRAESASEIARSGTDQWNTGLSVWGVSKTRGIGD